MNPSNTFTLVFASTLVLAVLLKWLLALRQIRHVARHRDCVPVAFAQKITLPSHQKAANYTIVKTRFSLIELSVGAAVLLVWTLLGGLDALNQSVNGFLPNTSALVQQLTLLLGFGLISSLIDIPFTLWRTFRIEERFEVGRAHV